MIQRQLIVKNYLANMCIQTHRQVVVYHERLVATFEVIFEMSLICLHRLHCQDILQVVEQVVVPKLLLLRLTHPLAPPLHICLQISV